MDSSGGSDDENSQKFNENTKGTKEKGNLSSRHRVICKRRKTGDFIQKKSNEKRWSVADAEVEAEMLEDMGVGKLSEGTQWSSETSNSSDEDSVSFSKSQTSINNSATLARPGETSKSADTTVGEKLTTPDNSQESPFVCTKEEIDFFLYRHKSRTEKPKEDQFARLSDEVILLIFSLMPKSMLIRVALVCKRWQRISYDETLWTRLDLSSRRLNAGAMGYVISRGTNTLRLAQTEFTDPIFLDDSLDEIFKLQYLDLSMASISTSGLSLLLNSCRHLKKLSLEHCTVGDDACRAIGRNENLAVLNMSGCTGVSPAGIKAVMACRKLTELNLAWTNLRLPAIDALISNLPETLLKLNLAGQRLTVVDNHISVIVEKCPLLTDLDVSDCTMLQQYAVGSLLTMKKLENLAISRCYNIPSSHILQFEHLKSLKSLEIFSLTKESCVELLQASFSHIVLNKNIHSQIARPTVGIRRTSIWGIRVRD